MRCILLIFVFLISSQTFGANNSHDFWLGYFKKTELTDKYSLWAETQLRFDLEAGEMGQTLIRGGLLRKIGQGSQEVGLLYAFIQTDNSKEHRTTLQHTMKYTTNLSHRMRFEFRSLENSVPLSERLRYLVRYQMNKKTAVGTPVVWNEIFVNFEKKASDEIDYFDRNRLFLGFRTKFKNLDFEYGYLNQTAPRSTESIIDHTLVVYFFFK